MYDREMISGRQLIALVFTFIIAFATFSLPAIAIRIAQQDAWISVFIAGFVGMLTVFMVTKVGARYPNLTTIEYAEIILGKWCGKFLGMILILFYVYINAVMVRLVTTMVKSTIMYESKLEIITFILLIACVYAVKNGLEVITRVNILILVVTFLAMFTCLGLLIKEMDIKLLTPILSRGVMPVLKASIPAFACFTEIASIGFIMPFINKPNETRISCIIGIIWVIITLVFFYMLVVMVFGSKISAMFVYPIYEAVRTINVEDFINRVEILFLIPWVLATIIKVIYFFYISLIVIQKYFKIQNKNTLLLPVGLLTFALSMVIFGNDIDILEFLEYVCGYFGLFIGILIPFILLVLDYFRSKKRRV